MPENLQYSERAEEFEQNADTLEEFRDALEGIILPDISDLDDIELPDPDDLDSAIENIDQIC
ncbi:MAG: hypothetical protein KBT12_08345 [Bacteroidales bacterium]|nr:hypothetical protein [Candidatus Physcousia equi]